MPVPSPAPPPKIIGNPNKRRYLDKLGHELRPGDTIMYATCASSSVYVNIAVISEILDTDKPVYVGYERNPDDSLPMQRVESWDRAFKLRVKVLERKDAEYDVWGVPDDITWDGMRQIRTKQTLDDVRTNMVKAVERVIKIDIPNRDLG